MFERILVPTDASPFAEQALPHAAALAKAANARLFLVMIHEMLPLGERLTLGSDLVESQFRESEEEYLESLARQVASSAGAEPDVALLTGTVVTELTRFASRKRIDLIVMSTHGRGGFSRAWMGSVADSLIRRARVPILLVRATGEDGPSRPPSIARVLVAVDGSEPAEIAVRHAATLCRVTGAECSIIRIVVPPIRIISSRIPDTAAMVREKTDEDSAEAREYLRDLLSRSPDLPESTRTAVVIGYQPAAAILDAAGSENVDVIAVGTRGHGAAARLIVGSVADKVIRGSPVPVLVCPARR
jgi:nucleotide-binding universal stress UspA family protein